MCGGTRPCAQSPHGHRGLSPRVRGNPPARPFRLPIRRSIPACAGEPVVVAIHGRDSWVYPRVCGGTALCDGFFEFFAGLSPRVRGNPVQYIRRNLEIGSIPACAGEPLLRQSLRQSVWVYPRVCGGTQSVSNAAAEHTGLSPRVRGNRRPAPASSCAMGSIPACAGEPAFFLPRTDKRTVYPRVCGGTISDLTTADILCGLSPRVRGNQEELPSPEAYQRSIPACAGEPVACHDSGVFLVVYPRVCGGTGVDSHRPGQPHGLSPRVRGNQLRQRRHFSHPGSIPACAGEPEKRSWGALPRKVYPRVCGGTIRGGLYNLAHEGLSPRVRGNLVDGCRPLDIRRSIPACAGEPAGQSGG